MASKPKGRPPLEPRIAALEDRWNLLVAAMREDFLAERKIQERRIQAIEARISEMNEAFSHARFPRAPQQSFSNNDQSQIPS